VTAAEALTRDSFLATILWVEIEHASPYGKSAGEKVLTPI
jgi:hypothetical protein